MYPHFPNYVALLSFGIPMLVLGLLAWRTARSGRTAGMFAIVVGAASAFLGTIGPVPGFAFGNCIQTWTGFILALLGALPSIVRVRRPTWKNILVLLLTVYLSVAWGTLIGGCLQDDPHHNDAMGRLAMPGGVQQ